MNCDWYLVYLLFENSKITSTVGNNMSKTASIQLAPSATWFSRLLAIIDHVLMTNARIANRNGDLPYFGL